METGEQITTAIACRKCRQEGTIVWENVAGGSKRSIFSISGGFYRRVRGLHSAAPSIICDSCGTVLKSHALSISAPAVDGIVPAP